MSDYQSVYHRFREMVMEIDADRLMANLARYHYFPNISDTLKTVTTIL